MVDKSTDLRAAIGVIGQTVEKIAALDIDTPATPALFNLPHVISYGALWCVGEGSVNTPTQPAWKRPPTGS